MSEVLTPVRPIFRAVACAVVPEASPLRDRGDRRHRQRARLGGGSLITRRYDVAIVGSGAGGGTVAQRLAALCERGLKVVVLEKGPKLRDEEFTGRELEMASTVYQDSGGVLTADRTMTLAMGVGYGGSTTVYTGTSLVPPARVILAWGVPGLDHADVAARAKQFMQENNVHLLEEELLNENNTMFRKGCQELGYEVKQFPVNVKGCPGSTSPTPRCSPTRSRSTPTSR